MDEVEFTMVTLDELQAVWHRADAVGLALDEERGLKIVRLADGTAYAAELAERPAR